MARRNSDSFSDLLTKAKRYVISLAEKIRIGPCRAYKRFGLKQIR